MEQTESPPAIGLRDATKRFGGTVAIDRVSFVLRAGEVLALLGENGAGKSTCVKLLAGLHQPDQGVVTLDFVDGATSISLNGSARGTIEGAAFNEALTKIWIGEHPAQPDLKKALLGGA